MNEIKFPSVPTYFITYQDINILAYGVVLPDQEMVSGLPFLYLTPDLFNSCNLLMQFNMVLKTKKHLSVHHTNIAAYLFLNSLPLATLKERYKTLNSANPLDYIFASMKKFGAVHRLPYVLDFEVWFNLAQIQRVCSNWSGYISTCVDKL